MTRSIYGADGVAGLTTDGQSYTPILIVPEIKPLRRFRRRANISNSFLSISDRGERSYGDSF